MGIYLNEAGAHTKLIKNRIEKYENDRKVANAYERLYNSTRTKDVEKRAIDKSNWANRRAQSRLNNIALPRNVKTMEDVDHIVQNIKKGISKNNNSPIKTDDDDSADDIRYAKKKLGVGKDNMPRYRRPNSYLNVQNALNASKKKQNIKEACEYILDMLDEEYYYDEYED